MIGRFHFFFLLVIISGLHSATAGEDRRGDTLSSYTVSIHLHGEKDADLKELLKSVSTAAADAKNPPPTRILLLAISESDVEKMEKVLRAKSFYAGTVRVDLKEKTGPLRLIFSVTTGKPFLLNEITIDISGPALPEDVTSPDQGETGLMKGARGTSASIIAGGERLLAHIRKQGYPFVKMADRCVVVDYATETIDVTFTISPGERTVFGKTTIKGLEDVDEEFVQRKIPWREGRFYDPALIQEFRNRLSRTGLFTMVLIPPLKEAPPPPSRSPSPPAGAAGATPAPLPLPVEITVRERDRHTVSLSAGYSTDLGFGGGFSWEDRNLFGEGEALRIKLSATEKMYMVEGRFLLPEFLHPEQSLILGIQPVYDKPDAYTSYRVRGSAVVRREISETVSLSAGAAATQDNVKQLGKVNDYSLLSVPLNAQWSIGGQPPFRRAGALFSFLGEPYWDLHSDRLFVKTMLNTNLLYRFPGTSGLSVFGRISLGSITEASPGEVPADLRFYAGGANSIRGYAYQLVGPMVGDKPVGGRSLLTFSLEFALEIIGEFGAAAFIDGGSAFAEVLPRRGDEILLGTGVGLRYFTPIGPIGLDIGFPLDKRKGIDDDFQVYVSIAQIF